MLNLTTFFLNSAGAFDNAAQPLVELFNSILTPLILVVGALGAIWCVLLGVRRMSLRREKKRRWHSRTRSSATS